MGRIIRSTGSALRACLGLLALLATTSITVPARAQDVPFLRGDANDDGKLSISDMLTIRRFLYNKEAPPTCMKTADVDDSGVLDLTDIVDIGQSLFTRHDPILAPFPEVGLDPTEDKLSCDSYVVVPAEETDDVVRIGEVEARPGEEVLIPVYLTNSVPVEAFQLFMAYDPAVLVFEEGPWGEANFDFSSTIYESLFGDDHIPPITQGWCTVVADSAADLVSISVIGSLLRTGYEVPSGADNLVIYIKATVSSDAAPGNYTLDLTNGPDGNGVTPPYYLKNEITYLGAARFVSQFPRRQAGRIGIVDDIIVFFVRGDSNSDDAVNISDPIFLLSHLYLGGPTPDCPDAADADDNGKLEASDAIVVLSTLFQGGGSVGIAPPYPAAGGDMSSDSLGPCVR